MFWGQYSHEPNIATLRFWHGWIGEANWSDLQRAQCPAKKATGEAALALMDEHLAGRDWLVGDGPTLADIVLYPYTHVAEGGGFDLADYPALQVWLKGVEDLPGYVRMDA